MCNAHGAKSQTINVNSSFLQPTAERPLLFFSKGVLQNGNALITFSKVFTKMAFPCFIFPFVYLKVFFIICSNAFHAQLASKLDDKLNVQTSFLNPRRANCLTKKRHGLSQRADKLAVQIVHVVVRVCWNPGNPGSILPQHGTLSHSIV